MRFICGNTHFSDFANILDIFITVVFLKKKLLLDLVVDEYVRDGNE